MECYGYEQKAGERMIRNPSFYGIQRLVVNDESITPTGSYATSTYYNTTYGVQV